MSYAPVPAAPSTYSTYSAHQSVLSGYSSSSDIEATNTSVADYSDQEAGYTSAASNNFEFSGFRPSQRMGSVPAYTQRNYNASSQSPPPATQIFTGMPTAMAMSGSSASPISQTSSPPGITTMMTSPQGGQQYQRIARFVGPPPVALACTECRSRHLKCDAGTPACGRCITDKRECSYVKSRRGWKGTRRKKVQTATAGAGEGPGHASEAPQQSGTDTEGPDGGYSSGKRNLSSFVAVLAMSGLARVFIYVFCGSEYRAISTLRASPRSPTGDRFQSRIWRQTLSKRPWTAALDGMHCQPHLFPCGPGTISDSRFPFSSLIQITFSFYSDMARRPPVRLYGTCI